jgi:formate dehydrogenase subunit gamma
MTPQDAAPADRRSLFADLIGEPGALLPVLLRIQTRLGFVPAEYVPVVAEALNLSRADVQGVLSFYADLRSAPPARHVLRICRAEACQAMGSDALQVTPVPGRLEVEPVYCLGLCACAPAVVIDEALHGRVTPERLAALVAELPE